MVELPGNASPKAREALEEVARCVRVGFTGSLVFDFKDGIPLVMKCTETRRFGAPANGSRLPAIDNEPLKL